MNGSSRRPRPIKAFRDAAGDAAEEPARGESSEKIVVHVHVHRDDESAAVPGGEPRRRRPTFSGQLFDWMGHYVPVAKLHHKALAKKAVGRWARLAKVLRQRTRR